jgi:hypothetical protein
LPSSNSNNPLEPEEMGIVRDRDDEFQILRHVVLLLFLSTSMLVVSISRTCMNHRLHRRLASLTSSKDRFAYLTILAGRKSCKREHFGSGGQCYVLAPKVTLWGAKFRKERAINGDNLHGAWKWL